MRLNSSVGLLFRFRNNDSYRYLDTKLKMLFRKVTRFFAIGIVIILVDQAAAQTPPGWQLVWEDEFDGSSLDTSKWQAIFSTNPTNNSLHAYLPSHVTVAGSNLIITSTDQPFNGLPYRSGQVISHAEMRFGRFEVRAKLPTSKGMWPAIWLLPNVSKYPWPSQGEIDIMENRGDEPLLTSSAFHWGTNNPYQHWFAYQEQAQYLGGSRANYHDDYHVYAVEWEDDQIRFYVDDVHHYTVFDNVTSGFISSQTAPMQMIINTAIGGDFLDNPDHTTVWPQVLLVDYVRVFQRSAKIYDQTFENGGFETNGGSLAHWSTFGNVTPNVVASNSESRSGTGSLKLFGRFAGGLNHSGVEQGITVTPGIKLNVSAFALTSSADSIQGTNNEAILVVDYYSKRHAAYQSPFYISSQSMVIADGNSAENIWTKSQFNSTVPAEAVEARVAVVFKQLGQQPGSVFVDDVKAVKLGIQPNTNPPTQIRR